MIYILLALAILVIIILLALITSLIKKYNGLKLTIADMSGRIRVIKDWFSLKQRKPDYLKDYLTANNIKTIGIIGNNLFSELLIKELRAIEIAEIKYIVAANWETSSEGIPLVKKWDSSVDCLIVTNDIKIENAPVMIFSVYDLIYEKVK